MFIGVGCTYAIAQMASWAYCMLYLRAKCPEFNEKVMKLRDLAQQGRMDKQSFGGAMQNPPQQQPSQLSNVDPNDYWTLQQQKYNNPSNPYLAANQEKRKDQIGSKSEFVDDDFDSGSDGKSSY